MQREGRQMAYLKQHKMQDRRESILLGLPTPDSYSGAFSPSGHGDNLSNIAHCLINIVLSHLADAAVPFYAWPRILMPQ